MAKVVGALLHNRSAVFTEGCAVFGMTEEQFAEFFMTYGVGALIVFMLFIIGHLAWESKAGKFGTFVLFLGLAVGFIGFIAKYIIQWYLDGK
jgi:hypothetical protein